MLTPKQKNLLDYINKYFSSKGLYPTYDEMRDALKIKSKSSIHKLISSIEEKGFITRMPHKARAIKLNNYRKQPETNSKIKIPFLGRIAAGNPIEAISNSFEQISVPDYLIGKSNDHFALEVIGDSMKDEGILNGDIVIIKKTSVANSGQIVVALIDEHEAMLKRIRKKGKVVALESANKNYETKIFGPDRVKVQGVLVSLYRNF